MKLSELWAHYGRALNLLGDLGPEGLLAHLTEGLDAVEVAARLGGNGLWVDVGSGAGSPGLVVACAREQPIVLVEPREKRAAFLRLAVGAIKLRWCTVRRGRWDRSTWNQMDDGDDLGADRSLISVIGSKAVMDPKKWVLVAREIAPHGAILCHVSDPGVSFDGLNPDVSVGEGRRWVVGLRPPT